MIYKSTRKFKLWVYIVSHCTLLLRSSSLYEDDGDYPEVLNSNIDIEFWGVDFMELSTKPLMDIQIIPVKENIPPRFKNFITGFGKLYELSTTDEKFYIVAAGFVVGTNTWGTGETRLFDFNLKYDTIIASSS